MATWLIALAVVALLGACFFFWSHLGHRKRLAQHQASPAASREVRAEELAQAAKWTYRVAIVCFIVATVALFWAFAVTQADTGSVPGPAESIPPASTPQ